MSSTIGIALLAIGLVFNLIGCIGLIRLPDVYNRLQAATKCVTMGTCCMLLGTLVLSASVPCALKCIVCVVFILITSPTAAHALSRGAYSFGVKLWDKSVVDAYAEKDQSGAASATRESE